MANRQLSELCTKRWTRLCIACVLIMLSRAVAQKAPATQPSVRTKVIFTRPLDGGVELVVKSTELVFTPALERSLRGWLEQDFVPRVFIFELHLPDGTVFPGCSFPFGDKRATPPADCWRIVDAIRIGDSMIFASYHNPDMMVVRYNLDSGEMERDFLGSGAWNNSSVHVKLSGTIKLSLSKNKTGLCTVEVIYEREGLRRITHFIETGDKWKFRMTDEKNIELRDAGNPGK